MQDLSLLELRRSLNNKLFSSVELTNYYLDRIKKHHTLNAFITINESNALLAAALADQKIHKGEAGLFTGIPMAHKDVFCTTECPTTCGSKMLAEFHSPYAATVVKQLAKAGFIMLGKTNMDEFAMGSANENSYFGAVANPWQLDKVSGGSSGGSAAAVAARLVPFATGSDTGGSIRQPAAFCGVSGIKPTYGLVSRFGMVAHASSLDQAGPIAPSAEDLAQILQVMAGYDELDSTSLKRSPPKMFINNKPNISSLRIGIFNPQTDKNLDVDIQQALTNALRVFETAGAEIIDLNLSLQDLWVPCYYILACAEASSNLARYDGIRYGHRANNTHTLDELITHSRNEGFGMEVKRRILTGTYVLSSGYQDAYFIKAQKIRRQIQNEFLSAFTKVDVIISPTTPGCAFDKGIKDFDAVKNYMEDAFTVPANLGGFPAVSIPAGFSTSKLPIGMQLMGPHFSENKLLNIAHFFQQQTNWHKAIPEDFK